MQSLDVVIRVQSGFFTLDGDLNGMPANACQVALFLDVLKRLPKKIKLAILHEAFCSMSLDIHGSDTRIDALVDVRCEVSCSWKDLANGLHLRRGRLKI